MYVDYVLNGQGFGQAGETLAGVNYDHHLMRPFIETNPNSPHRGRPCCNMQTGRMKVDDKGRAYPEVKKHLIRDLQERQINSPVFNATLLPKDAWIQLDQVVLKVQRQELTAWADLMARNPFGGFDAMGMLTLEYSTVSDAGEALQDMDLLADGRTDRPLIEMKSIPLPITHSDFWFSEREIAVSRNKRMPLDDTMAEQAARRNAELIEKQTIGVVAGMSFGTRSTGPNPHTGTSAVYGYTNYPYRITKTDLTTPTGANPEAVMNDVLEMIELAIAAGYNGPYVLYTSTGYSRFVNDDYFRSGSTSAVRSLRQRLLEIEGITEIKRLNYLTSGYQLILVQFSGPGAPRAINGLAPTLIQWESQGGARKNFKVIQIQVPQLRSTSAGVTGIVHGTTS